MTLRRVLVAPDKFKGSLTGIEVAAAVASGVRRVVPGADVVCLPVADGGDGTLDAVSATGFARVAVQASGPTGVPGQTSYARRGATAVVEMADVCGLSRLPAGRPEPLTASSRGLGEVMAAALDAGCRDLIVGIGGSASTDGGAGMLAALGAVLHPPVPDGGGSLGEVASVDLTHLHPGLATARVVIACDVDNPLTGPRGAAHVYAPQKGATPRDVDDLDTNLTRWAEVVARATGNDARARPGAGAAGGVGLALVAALGAQLRPGVELLLELGNFGAHVEGADLVITGEGSLDAQSLYGKAPVGVAAAARRARVPVVAVCGRNSLTVDDLRGAGISSAHALVDIEPDVAVCMSEPARLLAEVGEAIARAHVAPPVA